MNTMYDLKNTTALVKSILEHDQQCRNSDSFLYLKVLSAAAKQKGIDLEKMTVPHFLLNLHGAGLPPFESVRRARQKLQAAYPHLAASETVRDFRTENEAAYREFARGEV
jgi:hypothetical protein